MKHSGDISNRAGEAWRGLLKRAKLKSAGLMLAAATLLPAQQVFAQEDIQRGGTHVRGEWLAVSHLDPHLLGELNPVFMAPYNYLFSYKMVDRETFRHELKGELVETWDQPDETTLIFNLREGVKFHDGSDFNAEVAKWNLDRLMTHPRSGAKSLLDSINTVSIIDDYTIELKLKYPAAGLLGALSGSAQSTTAMISKVAMEKMGEDAFATNPVGTGPFRFESWVRDDRVTFKRFEDYWEMGADGEPLPYLDEYILRYAQAPQLMLMMRSGEIESTRWINVEDVAIAKKDPTIVVEETLHNQRLEPIIGFNGTNGPLSDNLKLRQAMLYAIDRQAMANALGFGQAVPHYYPYWGPGSFGWDDSIKKYEYDPEKAKQLVIDAGYPDGVDIQLMIMGRPNYLRDAEVLKNMWDAVGIRTSVEPLERTAFSLKGVNGEGYDAIFTAAQVKPDPTTLNRFMLKGGSSNRNAHYSPDFEACMAEGAAEYDSAKRHDIYKRCVTIMQEEAYFGSAFSTPSTFLHKDYVKGFNLQWDNPDPRAVWHDK